MKQAQKEQVAETEAIEKEFVEESTLANQESKDVSTPTEKDSDDGMPLFEFESELTPIQRFALKFIESGNLKENIRREETWNIEQPKETTDMMVEETSTNKFNHDMDEDVDKEDDEVEEEQEYDEEDDRSVAEPNGEDTLLYEVVM